MSWRIGIEHTSTYRYAGPVIASFNEARITPRGSNRQTVLRTSLVVLPQAVLYSYLDYWQTSVISFDVTQPHTELKIIGSADVETSTANPIVSTLPWNEIIDPSIMNRMGEYLLPTPYTKLNDELIEIGKGFAKGETPFDTVEAISAWVRSVMTYQTGSTQVSTSALEAWQQGRGVCQDFAHLAIGLLRSLGIPARYVSGYLHPDADATVGESVKGASHAWIEAWVGSWHGVDPTNGNPIDERHVNVARGRDYADVTPFRGVYQGGRLESLTVEVDLTRIA